MTRTNIDIDDELIAAVMRENHIATKREAVDFALREVRRRRRLTKEQALAMQGSGGWIGDLDVMRDGVNPAGAPR